MVHFPYFDQTTIEEWQRLASGEVEDDDERQEIVNNWMTAMQNYTNYMGASNSGRKTHFWIALKVMKNDYSERIMEHPEIPMMVPVSGTGDIACVAATKEQLDQMITPDPDNLRDTRRDYVYLIYKIKLQGEDSWRKFLEFCGKNNLIERDA